MRYKLRDIRIFPFAILLLFFLLVFFNIRAKSRIHSPLSPAGSGAQNPGLDRFDEFTPSLFNYGGGAADDNPSARFEITSNEKNEDIQCRVRFRMKKEEDLLLLFSWYRENTLMRQDSLWASGQDTACATHYAVPRNETGNWSVDIALRDNRLLKTLSFTVENRINPRRYRSLKNDS